MKFRTILLYQSVGFIALMALSWFDEVIGLRSLVFGSNPYISDFRESTLEMLFVLGVWFVVIGATRRLLTRVSDLEKYLRVCAWCHRVGMKSEWLPWEEFMTRKFETRMSHGICQDCLKGHRAALEEIKRRQPLLPLSELQTPPSPG